MQHSRLPPSSCFRWSECTASVSFVEENDRILPASGGVEADEGTRAHSYLTWLLKPQALEAKPDNDEMRRAVEGCRDYVLQLIQPGDRLLVDQRVPLYYLPSQSGTLDISLSSFKRIVVVDYKHGVGVGVYAEKNKQLIVYAESQIRELEKIDRFEDSTPVKLVIYQPRDRLDPNPIREWPITRAELREHANAIEAKAKVVLSGVGLEFKPGPACKFCRATGICKAYATQGLEAISNEPVDVVVSKPLVLSDPRSLTRAQRQKVLAAKAVLHEWLEAVEDQEVSELMSGAQPEQFKLVAGKANRIWSDPERAERLLVQHLQSVQVRPPTPPELISPAQAENLLKGVPLGEEWKAAFAATITKPEGKPTLVPITDKRPALEFNPTEGLSVIPEYDPNTLI